MPPAYVKPYIRRQKNDASDAAAICEAVTRPTMRFVGVRSQENQAALMRHKTREMLVSQRTQLLNALRGHLTEVGVAAKWRSRTTSGGSSIAPSNSQGVRTERLARGRQARTHRPATRRIDVDVRLDPIQLKGPVMTGNRSVARRPGRLRQRMFESSVASSSFGQRLNKACSAHLPSIRASW